MQEKEKPGGGEKKSAPLFGLPNGAMREGGGGRAWHLSSREHRPWPDLGVSGGVLVAPAARGGGGSGGGSGAAGAGRAGRQWEGGAVVVVAVLAAVPPLLPRVPAMRASIWSLTLARLPSSLRGLVPNAMYLFAALPWHSPGAALKTCTEPTRRPVGEKRITHVALRPPPRFIAHGLEHVVTRCLRAEGVSEEHDAVLLLEAGLDAQPLAAE